MAAALRNQVQFLKLLLEAGAHLEARLYNGATALSFAVAGDRSAAVGLLLKVGANVNVGASSLLYGTVLSEAVGRGNVDIARMLIEAGVDVTARRMVGAGLGGLEDPPLTVTAKHGNVPMVQLLLAAGARIDARDATGSTALDRAKQWGHQPVIELLRRAAEKR